MLGIERFHRILAAGWAFRTLDNPNQLSWSPYRYGFTSAFTTDPTQQSAKPQGPSAALPSSKRVRPIPSASGSEYSVTIGILSLVADLRSIMKRSKTIFLGTSVIAMVATASLGAGSASAHNRPEPPGKGAAKTVTLHAKLHELNNSGASGTATAVVRNQKIRHIEVHAKGLTPNAPHAQHIHYGQQALNECPTLAQDANGDGRVNTVEGLPAYGPVVVSLNTTGDTKPASFLDVTRFPVSNSGSYDYSRKNIKFTRVAGTGYSGGGGTAKQIADSVREGEGVLVIHGVDYNGDGTYDFGAGASELDSSLPAEATDPAACGVLKVVK